MFNFWSQNTQKSKIVWLDLGDLGDLVKPDGPHEQWQDHGLGLLRTILHNHGVNTDLLSTRAVTSWEQLRKQLQGYDILIMNVRSYTFPVAYKSAKIFKEINPNGLVLTGGMHATVALDEMTAIPEFDRICQGPGENVIVNLVNDPLSFPRVIVGIGSKSMAEWPMIDRTLWPKPHRRLRRNSIGPWSRNVAGDRPRSPRLSPAGFVPGSVFSATRILTSRIWAAGRLIWSSTN